MPNLTKQTARVKQRPRLQNGILVKTCSDCHWTKSLQDFATKGTTPSGKPHWMPCCKICVKERRRLVSKNHRLRNSESARQYHSNYYRAHRSREVEVRQRRLVARSGHKICRKCFTEYPANSLYFHRYARSPDGLKARCIKCVQPVNRTGALARHRKKAAQGICPGCNAPARSNRVFCQSCADKQESARITRELRLASRGLCTGCGKLPQSASTPLCDSCNERRRAHAKKQHRENVRLQPERQRNRNWRNKEVYYQRKAKAPSERVSRKRVIERDESICYICKKECEPRNQ